MLSGWNCIAIGRLVVEPLYCNTRIVLQLGCVVAGFVLQEEAVENCIAIQLLYCNLGGWMAGVLCHNTLQCIVTNRGSSSVSQYWASGSSTVCEQ